MIRKAAAAAALLCVLPGLISARPMDRTIALYNIHTKETVEVTFRKAGQLQHDAIKKLNWVMRDWRRNEPATMDTRLIDLLWEIHRELGSRQPIHLISGYRSPKTNAHLRRTRGGQATKSRHMTGQAADVHFPDVPLKELRYSALIREQGGVGYYPTSAIPFVHVDTGHVRAWPRLPRYELALLFPNGSTRHRPISGPPITRDDVREARRTSPDLVRKLAAFHDMRATGRRETLVASLDTIPVPRPATRPEPARNLEPLPQLAAAPRLATRPASTHPTDEDRHKLNELAALAAAHPPPLVTGPVLARRPTPAISPAAPPQSQRQPEQHGTARFAFAPSWVQAPEYDDEHPGELSYRPFPIRPYLTATASMDEPIMRRFVYRASNRIFALLDQTDDLPLLQMRPERQIAEVILSNEETGGDTNVAPLMEKASAGAGLPSQKIRTTNHR